MAPTAPFNAYEDVNEYDELILDDPPLPALRANDADNAYDDEMVDELPDKILVNGEEFKLTKVRRK